MKGGKFAVLTAAAMLVWFSVSVLTAEAPRDKSSTLLKSLRGSKSSQSSSVSRSSSSGSAAVEKIGETTAFQVFTLKEVNFARTDPAGYARVRLLKLMKDKKDNGAYKDLLAHNPRKALTLDDKLNRAAQKYAEFLARNNRWGHNENGSPFDRMKSEGYVYRTAGENIAAGSWASHNALETPEEAAIAFVLQWIVDEGVPGVGHRKNIMNDAFTQMGVGFGRNTKAKYVNYAVQEFGTPLK